MKMEKYIDVTIDEQGEIIVEAFNFIGKTCLNDVLFVKEAIGYMTTRKLKPEYYKATKMGVHKHVPICG